LAVKTVKIVLCQNKGFSSKNSQLMNFKDSDRQNMLNAGRLLNSNEVMYIGGIKSHTTLIKLEREGEIEVARRIGNRKRYAPAHIKIVFGL
jgi:hypothetical protein